MKKTLLIFMLVLGMTSLANAALTGVELSFNGTTDGPGNVTMVEDYMICDEVVINVTGPAGLDWLGYIIIEGAYPGAGGEWGDNLGPPYEPTCSGYYYENTAYPIILSGAGDMANVARYEEEGWGFGYGVVAAQSTGEVPGGAQFEFVYHCCGPECEYVTITLWDDVEGYDTPQDTIIIHQIPEPATIILLGLGGLLLRRRR